MNKGIVIKASIILGFFLVVLGLAYGCSTIKDNESTPNISNGEDIYLELDEFSFTNQEVWDLMKIADGLSYLYQYVDEMNLADTIATLTQDEIDQEILYSKYGTIDEDRIAEILADEELSNSVDEAFSQNLVLLGYNPEDPDDLKAFVQLNAARRKVATEFILNNVPPQEGAEATAVDNFYIDADKLQTYYEDNNRGDVCVLDIRFSSANEGEAVLEHFNLVPNYNAGWGLYTGDTPIADVPTDDFTDDNTIELNEAEVFSRLVEVYNYMNPNNTIDEATDLETYCADYRDLGVRSYTDMTEDYDANSASVTYANYLFDTLGLEEDEARYSTSLQTVGGFNVLTYLVEKEALTPFDDLTGPELEALNDEVFTSILTNENISIIVDHLYQDTELEIFDPVLKLQNESTTGTSFDNKGDDTIVATYGDVEITADDLFEYMNDSIGSYYSLELTRRLMLLNSDAYTDVYGDSLDFLNSKNDNMVTHREDLRVMKTNFGQDAFAQYGFSVENYTWDEFLIAAFRSYTEATVIRDVYVLNALTPTLLEGQIEYDHAVDYIQEQVDNYFSLEAEQLNLYVDYDFDFEPDNWTELKETFSEQELNDYSVLKAGLETLIQDKLAEEMTFEEIVDEFNDGLLGDEDNEWAEYKTFGFYIKKETLSVEDKTELNYTTVKDSDLEDLIPTFQRIYTDYVYETNNSTEDVVEHYDDRLVETEDGLHFILATEGSGFEQPSAVFDNSAGDYTEGVGNDSMTPNRSQVELYIELKYGQQIDQASDELPLMPSEVIDALEAYYLPFFNTYLSSSSYNLQSAEYILANNPTFTENQADHISFLENAIDVLYEISFFDTYIRTDNN